MPKLIDRKEGIPNPDKRTKLQIMRYVRQHYPSYLLSLTPDGIEAKIDAEVTDLSSAKTALKSLAQAIAINAQAMKYLINSLEK